MVICEVKKNIITKKILKSTDLDLKELISLIFIKEIDIQSSRCYEKQNIYEKNK